jgi:hypothetical protein
MCVLTGTVRAPRLISPPGLFIRREEIFIRAVYYLYYLLNSIDDQTSLEIRELASGLRSILTPGLRSILTSRRTSRRTGRRTGLGIFEVQLYGVF